MSSSIDTSIDDSHSVNEVDLESNRKNDKKSTKKKNSKSGSTTATKKKGFMDMIKDNKMIIILIIAVVILLVYWFVIRKKMKMPKITADNVVPTVDNAVTTIASESMNMIKNLKTNIPIVKT